MRDALTTYLAGEKNAGLLLAGVVYLSELSARKRRPPSLRLDIYVRDTRAGCFDFRIEREQTGVER
jgi:hypothetical protein